MSDSYPDSWERKQVQKVIIKSFCGHSPTCEERPIANENEWGILKTTAITWDSWNENAHKVPPPKYWGKENIEVKKGDVLVTKAGPRHRVGVVVHVQSTKPHLMVSGKMIGLRPQQEMVLPRILAAALSMQEPQIFLDHRSTGMAESQVNFNNDVLLTTTILLPPIPEQRAIAAIIDTVDETIRRTEALIAKLRQVKAGMLHDLLTRGLDENGELRDPIRHPEQFKDSPLGRIPREWIYGPLSLFVPSAEYGISTSLGDTGYPVLRMNNFLDGEAELSELKYTPISVPEKLWLCSGDVLFNRTNSWEHVGRTGIWRGQIERATFASYLVRLNPNPDLLNTELLNLWLNWPMTQILMRRFATPAVQQVNINPTNLRKIQAAFPKSMREQARIISYISQQNKSIRSEQSVFMKRKQLKQGLMQDLLTGHVRVPEAMIKKYQTETEEN